MGRVDLGFRTYAPGDVGARTVLTVGELTEQLRFIVGHNRFLKGLWIRGEVADPSAGPTGHLFFALVDEEARLSCIMFAREARALPFALEEGQEVVAGGDLEVYGPKGAYELVVRSLEPAGLGAQFLALAQRRARLEAEGLFSAATKRPLPRFPATVGVVTSEQGVALDDILRVLGERWPLARVVVSPAQVQGEGAAASIVAALRRLDRHGGVDVVLVGRGGGPGEDLAAFNDEAVVRALRACRSPVVTCVGHEVDWTLADLAADARAPAPAAGAALVVPDARAIGQALARTAAAMDRALQRTLAAASEALGSRGRLLAPALVGEGLSRRRAALGAAWASLAAALGTRLGQARERLAALGGLLRASDPRALLDRGYALVLGEPGRRPVASVRGLAAGEAIAVVLVDGEVACRVVAIRPRPT